MSKFKYRQKVKFKDPDHFYRGLVAECEGYYTGAFTNQVISYELLFPDGHKADAGENELEDASELIVGVTDGKESIQMGVEDVNKK